MFLDSSRSSHPHSWYVQNFPMPLINLQVPLEILDRRLRYHNNKMIQQVLVRWSRTPSEMSTEEDEKALHQEFPRAPAWGQAVFQGRRSVTRLTTSSERQGEAEGANLPDDERAGLKTREKRVKKPNPRVAGPEWLQLGLPEPM